MHSQVQSIPLPPDPLFYYVSSVSPTSSLSPVWRAGQGGQQQTPAAGLRHSVGDQQAVFDQLCASSCIASQYQMWGDP